MGQAFKTLPEGFCRFTRQENWFIGTARGLSSLVIGMVLNSIIFSCFSLRANWVLAPKRRKCDLIVMSACSVFII